MYLCRRYEEESCFYIGNSAGDGGWLVPVNAPQTYGFNVDEIPLPAVGKTVKVQFRGLSMEENTGYRYGLVAIDNDNHPTYLGANSETKKTLTFKNPGNMKSLYLVMVGSPTKEYLPQIFTTYKYIIKY